MSELSARLIRLFMRPGCHLCEDAAELLEWLSRRNPIEIVEVNILDDLDLFERYKHHIPVVEIAGGPTLTAPIRAAELERILVGLSARSGGIADTAATRE
jgi:thiol-disulfide isomerase/thioredoxin